MPSACEPARRRYPAMPPNRVGRQSSALQALEAAVLLPVRDRGVERAQFNIGGVYVVCDDLVAESGPRHLAGGEEIPGVPQVRRYPGLIGGQVRVALVGRLKLKPAIHAMESGRDGRTQGQIRGQIRTPGTS